MNKIKAFLLLLICSIQTNIIAIEIPTSEASRKAISSVEKSLKKELLEKNLKYGSPIFIRIFKEPGILELWIESQSREFQLFKKYNICSFSGSLGPKVKQGDYQSPEGFYFVTPNQLNPWSRFHLSFNLGYPNKYDRYHGRTGSALMVHGNCVSIGCYAMTDKYISEIYALAVAALSGNQKRKNQDFFRVHIFPFELKTDRLSKYRSNQWFTFWDNLREGYEHFEKYKKPPNVEVKNGKYIFELNRY